MAEYQMRVGDGRRGATAAIARRARLGPGALRPDGQCSLRRIARDRAATGAHRRQDDHRRGERALDDMAFVGQARRAVVNDPDIGRSAADIDADQVAVTRGGTDEGKPRPRRPPSRQCRLDRPVLRSRRPTKQANHSTRRRSQSRIAAIEARVALHHRRSAHRGPRRGTVRP